MKAIAYRQHQIAAAIALSFAAAGLTLPSVADAGNVKSGNIEVSKVQGRSSTSQGSGVAIATGGQDHAALGRGNHSNHGSPAQQVATQADGGSLQMSGRGSTRGNSHAKAGTATRIASNR